MALSRDAVGARGRLQGRERAASDLERMMHARYDGVVVLGTEEDFRAQIERGLQGRWTEEIRALVTRGDIEQELLDTRDGQTAPAWCDGALLQLGRGLARKRVD